MKSFDLAFSKSEIEEASKRLPSIGHYYRMLERASFDLSQNQKYERHLEWLKLALGSYFNNKSQKDLCYDWSQYFFQLIPKAYEQLKSDSDTPYGILAMGKLGAMELNLSSDIDLIFVGDYQQTSADHLRRLQKYISEPDAFGFFQRFDADLRPGGKYSNIIQSYNQIESYYFNHGETWERLALLRMQCLYASEELKSQISFLKKNFCFRRHIDYGVFEDLSILRSRIRKEYIENSDRNSIHVKLCPGGIRDIELFAHALCILHGGRTQEIVSPSTESILLNLSKYQLLPATEAQFLIEMYWSLRRLENLIQAENDGQRHSLKKDDWRIQLCFQSLKAFEDKLKFCDEIVSSFIKIQEIPDSLPDTLESQKSYLLTKGFSESAIERNWQELIQLTALSRRSEEDEKIRKEVLKQFLNQIVEKSQDKDLSLAILKDFFKAMRAKASLFRFFQHHPQVMEDLSVIFGLSPFLSAKLCARPELIDNIVFRAQAQPPSDTEQLLEHLADHKQLAEILYGLDFSRNKKLEQLTQNLSNTADYISRILLSICTEDSKLNILKLGKWGGSELGLNADLDFIFVYSSDKIPEEAHKATRKFMSLMGANYKSGKLYDIDLRLRPSGNAGPLLVSYQNLSNYLSQKADLWELQAYLRASFLNGEAKSLHEYVFANPKLQGSFASLKTIRERLTEENVKQGQIHLKYSEGGILPIELISQEFALRSKKLSQKVDNSDLLTLLLEAYPFAHPLMEIYNFLRLVEQCVRFLRQGQSMALNQKDPIYKKIERFLSIHDVEERLNLALSDSKQIILQINEHFS